jgi:hypothetical protein
MVGIAMPPKADNPRLDPNLLGNRPGAAPGCRQQNDPSPLQIALHRHRRAATCLKHLATFLRKVNFSCFGYHPDVESRLTLYEKWVLARRRMAKVRPTRNYCMHLSEPKPARANSSKSESEGILLRGGMLIPSFYWVGRIFLLGREDGMGKPHSMLLRERVVAAIEGGEPRLLHLVSPSDDGFYPFLEQVRGPQVSSSTRAATTVPPSRSWLVAISAQLDFLTGNPLLFVILALTKNVERQTENAVTISIIQCEKQI